MFRNSSKKKGRKQVIRTALRNNNTRNYKNNNNDGDSSSEEEENPTYNKIIIKQRHKKRKAKGMVVRSSLLEGSRVIEESNKSTVYDDDDDDVLVSDAAANKETTTISSSNNNNKMKKKKRKKRSSGTGMGFGGGMPAVTDEGATEPLNDEEEITTASPRASSLYGKEALKRLKAEQKTTPSSVKERVQVTTQPTSDNKKIISAKDSTLANINNNASAVEERNFIALQEESIMMETTEDPGTSFSVPNSTWPEFMVPVAAATEVEPEESIEWQNQVAKRAGLSLLHHHHHHEDDNTINQKRIIPKTTPPSLQHLKDQFQSTLHNLQNQQEDLGNAIMRRQADLQQSEADRIRYEETLKESGMACEYYQGLQNDIANWVGALRDLQSKVKPVFEALLQIALDALTTAEEKWKQCTEDVLSLLHQMNAVDQVVGYYQPPKPIITPSLDDFMAVTVDEFGRDVKSQFLRDRDKRFKMLLLEHTASSLEPNDNDHPVVEQRLDYLWLETTKLGGRKERYEYLQQALQVAMEDLDANYTSLEKLVSVFDGWKQQSNNNYSEDYRQCYAVLSLGDLSATLVQANFCRTSKILRMFATASNQELAKEEDDDDDDDSLTLLKTLQDMDDGIGLEQGDSGAMQRVLERNHVRLLLEVLKKKPFGCFISSTKSLALSQMMVACAERIDKNTKTYSSILKAVYTSIEEALERVSIVILKKDFDARDAITDGVGIPKEQVEFSLKFASSEQAKWIQHFLVNIIDHWLVALQSSSHYEAAMERILQFLSERYLLLLSSMDKEVASMVFAPIWTTLSKRHSTFIDSPALVIQSAPVRAAAMAYGLN